MTTLSEYCDALKLALRQVLLLPSSVSPIEIARLLASDPRNPEKLEARARHDRFVALLKSESPQDTITPDASGVYDEESWR